ncbi:YdeI/OmpD-associated family protein [Flavobacteriaceae bacterium F89]|uniref:YdeI/OmpD-associated family protein n=1 Tax=Cerina litoralis TaxID=2874477 RepID=A0AAE3EV65_9FLAO|nr:YdeI/OmpD-associated family protein [Cerina litoralis]MCG2461125.1 YdeI/OmpD-associated family protein [Cerina litoralis]
MALKLPEHYFKSKKEWRNWLHGNHNTSTGIYLIFYSVAHEAESMRWEEAVQVAICYGWIDSTVWSLGNGKRRQYFCPRKPKSGWSRINKNYVKELSKKGHLHASGIEKIEQAKKNGSWSLLDDVEKGKIPEDLKQAFGARPFAYQNYVNFSQGYQKSYLYWLNQAKREATRKRRIQEIIRLCEANLKSRG